METDKIAPGSYDCFWFLCVLLVFSLLLVLRSMTVSTISHEFYSFCGILPVLMTVTGFQVYY